jgi:hypothetical protein
MRMVIGKNWITAVSVHVLCVTFVCLTLEGARSSAAGTGPGAATSADAAGLEGGVGGGGPFTLRSWQPTAAFMNSWAAADTSEVEFPDEPETEKHLVRDVAVFVMVAAFVGFFIAEVFLNKEPDETPPDDGGKPIPTATLAR